MFRDKDRGMNSRRDVVAGPTYAEMREPTQLPERLQRRAAIALAAEELAPVNLFNVTWRPLPEPLGGGKRVNHLVLPRELTGVDANIIVLLGKDFPSGSHKVGPAYATLAEAEAEGEIRPGEKQIIGPSTGNFGIGTAYVARLKGYQAIVVMPDTMSQERYDRIKRYGGELDLTPGTESDVILTLERTHEVYMRNPQYKVLAQFELLPNYRFHRYVTGDAVLDAAAGYGNGQVAAFVSAPGSAGTLAAGDAVKERYPDAIVAAMEPRECPTLYNQGVGQHRIEGIGDKMVTLIHNVLTTDLVVLVHDDDTVRGVKVLQDGMEALCGIGVPRDDCERFIGAFGMSGVGNVIAAIKTAKYLGLGKQDNVVTVATDSFDRYPSVMAELERRVGAIDGGTMGTWGESIFRGATTDEVLDVRPQTQKGRLYEQKREVWSRFGYSEAYLRSMQSQEFWDKEYERIPEIDEAIRAVRGALPAT
jgi:cysteine synthase